jgi:general secretion pathway protein J
MSRPDAQAGYTLVETLVSLSILALLALLITSGAQFARLQLARGGDDAGRGRAIQAAQGFLRARLQRAFAYGKTVLTGSPTVDFDGQPDHIRFYASPPDARAPDALQQYDLEVAPGGVLRLRMISDLANDPSAAQATPLLAGVAGVDIAYFGAAAPDGRPQWRARWEQQPNLPRLVRLRVRFAPGDRRFWPDLIVSPAATLDSLCEIETNTGSCRGRS